MDLREHSHEDSSFPASNHSDSNSSPRHYNSGDDDFPAVMAAMHADLKLEMTPLWNSDSAQAVVAQLHEDFTERRSLANRTRQRTPDMSLSPHHQHDMNSLLMSPVRNSSSHQLGSLPKRSTLTAIPLAQQQVEMQIQRHRSGMGGQGGSLYANFDSGLSNIGQGDPLLDQWESAVRPPSEKRARLGDQTDISPKSGRQIQNLEGLTTIRDSLPGNRSRREGITQTQGSSTPSRANVQGINEMLQRFNPPTAPQPQSNSLMNVSPPFDNFVLGEIPPLLQNQSPFPDTERHHRVFEDGWAHLQGLSVKNLGTLGASHDAATMEQLLVHCAQALENKDFNLAQQIMWVLNSIASAEGDPNQRVTACFLRALIRRSGLMASSNYGQERISKVVSAVELAVMVDITPWYRFGFKAANGAILEACAGKDRIHIIDFSTAYGMQWPTLIESLSERSEGPMHIRLSIHKSRPKVPPFLGMSTEEVANRLMIFASHRNVDLKVNIIPHEIEMLERSAFQLRDDEALAVNIMMRGRFIPEETANPPHNSRDSFLGLIHSLRPAIVTLVDEEATLTSPSLVTRLKAAYNYVWIPFDALDTFLPRDSPQRMNYESDLGVKIENIIACEGLQRIERVETKERWGHRLKRIGFEPVGFSADVQSDVKNMLNDHAAGWGYKQDDDAALLTWKGHNVIFATSWKPLRHRRAS